VKSDVASGDLREDSVKTRFVRSPDWRPEESGLLRTVNEVLKLRAMPQGIPDRIPPLIPWPGRSTHHGFEEARDVLFILAVSAIALLTCSDDRRRVGIWLIKQRARWNMLFRFSRSPTVNAPASELARSRTT